MAHGKPEALKDGLLIENLVPGTIIGPPERRLRLLYDLTGKKHIWLVRAIAPMHDPSGEEEGLQVIKILLPPSRTGLAEGGCDDRAQRTDVIGLRAYLTKAKARVELAAQFNHPDIAQIRGWRQGADGFPFAEMEYVDHHTSQTLADKLSAHSQKGFPWETIMAWLTPVIGALDAARITHRMAHQHLDLDVISIHHTGTVKLLGFGVATVLQEPRSLLFSSGIPTTGTSEEASTESTRLEAALRRDVFALSLMIYQLLTGQDVYQTQGDSAYTVLCPQGLTDDAWRILRRGLAYPSELCPTDAGSFLYALDAAQRPGFKAKQRKHLRVRRWMLAVCVCVLGLAPLSYWLVWKDTPLLLPAFEEPESVHVTGHTTTVQDRDRAAQAAANEADQQAFEAAQRVGTPVAYRIYLQRCPPCAHEPVIRAALQQMENVEKARNLRATFETAMIGLEKENRGEKGDVALTQLNELAALVPADPLIASGRNRLVIAWAALAQTKLNQSDLNGARQWIKKAESLQIDRPEIKAVSQRLDQLEMAAHFQQVDTEAFTTAQRVHTRKAYWAYLERCAPICSHRPAAEAALAQLAPANKVLRDRLSNGSQGPEMVIIPKGRFSMGSPPAERGRYADELTHVVDINAFAIGKYEVTFDEYDAFAKAAGRAVPNDQGWGRGRRPVMNVNWQEATGYAQWLSTQTGQRYRLPTESEWEYAARAGITTARFWGDDPDQGCAYANAADVDGKRTFLGWTAMQCHDGAVYTATVGSYRNNDFGLHDMLGNVSEWTCSLYDRDNPSPAQSCQEPAAGAKMVIRGGAWGDEPRDVRSAERYRNDPETRSHAVGFRVLREMP